MIRAVHWVNHKVHIEILLLVFNHTTAGPDAQHNVKVAPMVIHWPTFGTSQALRGTDTVTIAPYTNPTRCFAVDQITKFNRHSPHRNECTKIGQLDRADGLVRFELRVVASKVDAPLL